jgi:hypothetical protein
MLFGIGSYDTGRNTARACPQETENSQGSAMGRMHRAPENRGNVDKNEVNKMRIKIVSLLVIMLLAACMLNVAAVSATTSTPAPVSYTLTINSSRYQWGGSNVLSIWDGGTLYFSGSFVDSHGQGVSAPGTLIDNGREMYSFYTAPDGSWGPYPITFHGAGERWVTFICGGLGATLYIQVYP